MGYAGQVVLTVAVGTAPQVVQWALKVGMGYGVRTPDQLLSAHAKGWLNPKGFICKQSYCFNRIFLHLKYIVDRENL